MIYIKHFEPSSFLIDFRNIAFQRRKTLPLLGLIIFIWLTDKKILGLTIDLDGFIMVLY